MCVPAVLCQFRHGISLQSMRDFSAPQTAPPFCVYVLNEFECVCVWPSVPAVQSPRKISVLIVSPESLGTWYLSLSIYIYIYRHTHTHILNPMSIYLIYIYIYIYIYTESHVYHVAGKIDTGFSIYRHVAGKIEVHGIHTSPIMSPLRKMTWESVP